MPATTQYEVVAHFKATGDLGKKINQMTRQLPTLDRQLQRAGMRAQQMGRMIEGSATRTVAAWGSAGVKIAAVAAVVSGGLLIRGGLKFNKIMEDTRLQAATMFQMFKLSEGQIGKNATAGEKWAQNLKNADFIMQGLFKVAKKTPASFQQVTTTYKGMAAGMSLATTDLTRQLKFMESVSLLGGLAGGDYTVLGAQMGRILAGSAGAEMNIWKVISRPIMEAGKSMKLFKKEMKLGADVTKAFNELSSPERLRILEAAMANFGEEMKTAYAESMAGIVSTTESQLQILSGMGTKPLYEGFRKWLIQINRSNMEEADRRRVRGAVPGSVLARVTGQGKEGLFSEGNMRRWSRLFATLGLHLGRLGQRMLDGLERAGFYILNNWPAMMDKFRSAWLFGVAAFKAMFVLMITRMVAGRLVGGAGMALGAGAGLLGGLRMIVGALTGGGKGKKFRNRMEGRAFLSRSGMWAFLGPLAGHAMKLAVSFGLLLPLFVVMGAAIAGVSVIVAGVAAYISEHWTSLLSKIASGEVVFTTLIKGWNTLWETLKKIGETVLGPGNPAEKLQRVLDSIGGALIWFAQLLSPLLDNLAGVIHLASASTRGNLEAAIARSKGTVGTFRKTGGVADESFMYGGKTVAQWREAVAVWNRREAAVTNLAGVAAVEASRERTPVELAAIEKKEAVIRKAAEEAAAKKAAKGTNVNIQNVIVNQDLRGLDPDRVFASFLPALEKVARDKTTAVSQLAFGA